MTTANTDPKQEKPGQWQKGQSGNPSGRAKGSRHKATLAALLLLDGDLEAITQVCIDKAKGGDLVAVKLILDKLLPQARERTIALKLPPVAGVGDLPKVLSAILKAVGQGVITPQEGASVAGLVELYRRGMELGDLEARMTAIEEREGQQ